MLPDDPKARKDIPIATGVLDYFPDAIAAVAELSRIGNEQHNPGQPLHWDRSKSTDEADALMRHFMQRGTVDKDGVRHSTKTAWRALALLQKEIEAAQLAAGTLSEAREISRPAWDSLAARAGIPVGKGAPQDATLWPTLDPEAK